MSAITHILVLAVLLTTAFRRRRGLEALRNPILLKEGLVSSRRRRFYLLRFGYLAVLAAFVAVIWKSQLPMMAGGDVGQLQIVMQALMADFGKKLVAQIVWFQFIAVQVVVAVIMSNSVNLEVQKRTLTALLTTPLSFFEMAWGKTLAGIRQVLVLVACSLPLLAMLRIFGGVPTDFLVETFYLTVASAFLSAAIAFQFSAIFSQPYVSAGLSILAIAAIHGMSIMVWPVVAVFFIYYTSKFSESLESPGRKAAYWLAVIVGVVFCLIVGLLPGGPAPVWMSPLWSMIAATQNLMSPGTFGNSSPLSAWAFVVIALGILKRAEKTLSGIAHDKAWGERPLPELMEPGTVPTNADDFWNGRTVYMPDPKEAADPDYWNRPSQRAQAELANKLPPPLPEAPVYGRVGKIGSAIVWKDWRHRVFHNDMVRFFLYYMPMVFGAMVYLCMLLMGMFLWPASNGLLLAVIYSWGGILTCVLASMTIAVERQAHTWPLLQTSLWSDWDIFLAKSGGVLLRTLPFWALAILHTLAFTIVGAMHPIMLIMVPVQIIVIVAFALAVGIAIGTRAGHASVAIIASAAVIGILWLVAPWLCVLAYRSSVNTGDWFWKLPMATISPAMQDVALLHQKSIFNWDSGQWITDPAGDAPWGASLLSLAGYGCFAALLAMLTMRRFRRHAFE